MTNLFPTCSIVVKSAIVALQSDSIKMDKLRSKVDERVVRLSDAISRDLTIPDVKKAQVQKSVKLLLRLGYGEQVIISHRCTFMHLGHKLIHVIFISKGTSDV